MVQQALACLLASGGVGCGEGSGAGLSGRGKGKGDVLGGKAVTAAVALRPDGRGRNLFLIVTLKQ